MVTRTGLAGLVLTACLLAPEGAALAGEGARGDLLVEGAGSVAAGESPARLRVDLARAGEGPARLALTPERVVGDEPFLVSVVAEGTDGATVEIASVSFFPPPREGETRSFPVDLSGLPDRGETTLAITLVPVSGSLDETRVRVEGLGAGE